MMKIMQAFKSLYPDWSGVPMEPPESVHLMLGIIDKVTPADTGKCISHKVSMLCALLFYLYSTAERVKAHIFRLSYAGKQRVALAV